MEQNKALAVATQSGLPLPCEANSYKLELCAPKVIDAALRDVRGVMQAAEAGTPSLSVLRKHHKHDKVHAIIALHLVRLNKMLGLRRPLDEEQIDFIAEELLREYSTLTLADLHLLFRRIASGAYGELYDSLTPPKLLDFASQYFNERCNLFAEREQNRANALRGSDSRGLSYQEAIKMFKSNHKKQQQ